MIRDFFGENSGGSDRRKKFPYQRLVKKIEIVNGKGGWRVQWYGSLPDNPPEFTDAYGSFFRQSPDETFKTLQAALNYIEAQQFED